MKDKFSCEYDKDLGDLLKNKNDIIFEIDKVLKSINEHKYYHNQLKFDLIEIQKQLNSVFNSDFEFVENQIKCCTNLISVISKFHNEVINNAKINQI